MLPECFSSLYLFIPITLSCSLSKNPKKDYINAVTTGKWTPALTAILLNRPETFRVLLENGASE